MTEKRLSLPLTDKQLRQLLLEQLQKKPLIRRKELIERCLRRIELTPQQRHDNSMDSLLVILKSRLGGELSSLLQKQLITENAIHQLQVVQNSHSLSQWDKAEEFVLQSLQERSPLPKQQLFQMAERAFGTDLTPDRKDDNDLHSLLGKVLQRLENEHRICRETKGYSLPIFPGLPNTELGYYLQKSRSGEDVKDCFLKAIHLKGGEWFEAYTVHLMCLYYEKTGKQVEQGYVTGGSNDGGIDGVVVTTDRLGFRERILLQMKNRNYQISPKDVREFFGAVCAENGSRGIYVTVANFHIDAQRLMDKVDNLVGIDGNKLFEIARFCGYGLLEQEGKLSLDESIFITE